MAEWSNATVLKTAVPQGTGGSNPSFSAKQKRKKAKKHTNPLLLFSFKGFFFFSLFLRIGKNHLNTHTWATQSATPFVWVAKKGL